MRGRGFSVNAKLTFRSNQTNRFENWPCLWVDQGADNTQLQRLTGIIKTFTAKLAAAGIEVDLDTIMATGGGDAFEEDREIQPNEEDFEHAASIQANKLNVAKGNVRSAQDPMTRVPTLNQPSAGFEGDPRQHGGTTRPGRSPAPEEYVEPEEQ